MDCEHCGAEMMLLRRSDADMGEILWFRCRVCDSGQMRSIPPPADETSIRPGLQIGKRPRRWFSHLIRMLKQRLG